ncbi:MAG: PAS domain S-box protein, partial [Betaproteobacteria bacterium]|nr:PAS domain S-box protein [Betaproteobacteria bacterium]
MARPASPSFRARLRFALERLSLVRLLVALGALLVAINVGSAIWDIRAARERALNDVQRDVSNITSLLLEQTAGALDAVDLILRDLQRMGTADQIMLAAPRLRDELAHVPQVAAVLVFDRDGRVVARTNETPNLDAAEERPYVEAHHGKDIGLYVSEPYLGGPGRRSWRFVLSRRLTAPGGGFAGVVAAVVEVDRYERLYRSIDLGEGGFITLLNEAGTVITRVPDPMALKGRKLPLSEAFQAARSAGRYDGRVVAPITSQPVIVSTAAVRGFPLFVVSGKTERAAVHAWMREMRFTAERTLITSLVMIGIVALAAWGLRRRERALEESEKRFRAMIERSSDAIVLNNQEAGGMLYVSPAFERLTGYSASEVLGRSLVDLVHPDHVGRAVKVRTEVLATAGKTLAAEFLLRQRDGSYRWVESNVTNLLHEPSVRATVVNLRDITERKEAEAEQARLENRLRQAAKMEAVGRLAGGIAHDFNNILGGILGYAEMLVESAPAGGAEHRYAKNVLAAAERASALVEQ